MERMIYVYIIDLGLCKPINDSQNSKGVYGVLPYMAPENSLYSSK